MERYLRVFRFAVQVARLAARKPVLLVPLAANIAFAAPLNLALAVLLALVDSDAGFYALLALGVTALYFIDHFANGVTVALLQQELEGPGAELETALQRARRVAGGIAQFAAISSLFDLLSEYAVERSDGVSRFATRLLQLFWTTASYALLPVLVLEASSFRGALERSRHLGSRHPTELGIGFLALGVVNYVAGLLTFAGAYKLLESMSDTHPVLSAVLFYTTVNVFFALSGYLKISYFTCFYLWVRKCERTRSEDSALAPAPLSAVLA